MELPKKSSSDVIQKIALSTPFNLTHGIAVHQKKKNFKFSNYCVNAWPEKLTFSMNSFSQYLYLMSIV